MPCEWCGDPSTGRFCSMRCSSESGWSTKLKFPRTEAKRLYVFEGWSVSRIAKKFQVSRNAVLRSLHKMGLELRSYTSTRVCKVPGCSQPVFKRVVRDAKGTSLSGTMCYQHTRERWRRKNDSRKEKVNAAYRAAKSKKREQVSRESGEVHQAHL